jgi:hypothetical protein
MSTRAKVPAELSTVQSEVREKRAGSERSWKLLKLKVRNLLQKQKETSQVSVHRNVLLTEFVESCRDSC